MAGPPLLRERLDTVDSGSERLDTVDSERIRETGHSGQ